jgi:hypothetical protein
VGHIIYSRIDDDDDILDQRCEFIKQVYNLYGYFIKLNSVTKSCLIRAYCSSFYGCELWRLSHHPTEDLSLAWRDGVRMGFAI